MSIPGLRPERTPPFLRPLLARVEAGDGIDMFPRRTPPPTGGRRAAVLMLFAEGPSGPDVLLVERASTLRNHAGQIAFPGGGTDPEDGGSPITTALREAEEETGLDPAGVVPLATLPELFLPPSGFVVTPVLAHWARPSPVRAVDLAETARVGRTPVAALADPANRINVSGPSGHIGHGFLVSGVLVWGFTGGILSALLDRAGWAHPWDESRVMDLGEAWSAARSAYTDEQEASGT
ncbi:CoA pyrophosphatase [Pseudonocardia ailaonensis]|uniref:CoA pyrophosphatase n=1 Tax=Pseudonocardia ailaonensis TaxID=367279 RepID=A0ABN2N5I3_9PSEU